MSEVILKALTHLFAIITKQDDGATPSELQFIERFFKSRLSPNSVSQYLTLYNTFYAEKKIINKTQINDEEKSKRKVKLSSMRDSLRTLSICKKINKTLTQKQKIVVLVELLELVNHDSNFTKKRKQIIDTVATVFNISKNELDLIEILITNKNLSTIDNEAFLIVSNTPNQSKKTHHIESKNIISATIFLHIASVGLYFVKKTGDEPIKLNNQEINKNQIYLYSNGSTLSIPNGTSIYYSDLISHYNNEASKTSISFNCKDVYYKFPNNAIGLHDINISENRGGLIGIMGASGAGKTTLLNVLAGIESPSSGKVIINGVNIHQSKQPSQGLIGYISQDDLLIEELTVFDNLYYNAKLCFKNKSKSTLVELVNKTLDNLGLAHIADIKVGSVLNKKISGGQRKRLNIALEIIREPAVLFVDEPTSGLSSRDSENVIDLLKELSHRGKLIFVVIHQPSSEIYKKFDKMYFMDTGGYPIFYGNPIDAVIYFKKESNHINSAQGQCSECGSVNPEQVFEIIEARIVNEFGILTSQRKVSPIQWNNLYKEKHKPTTIENTINKSSGSLNIPSRLKQWYTFVIRDSKSKTNNIPYLLINLFEAPILAIALSLIIRYNDAPNGSYTFGFNENIPAYLLISIIISLFMGLSISAEEIIRDKKILKREQFLHLSKSSYLFSKITILFSLSAIQTLSFILIGNYVLEIQGMAMSYWAILFSCACMANILGLNISAAFDNAVTVYILIPILLIPQMILSGAIFDFDRLNPALSSKDKTPLISDVMASRWAYEALAVEQFKNNQYEEMYYELNQKMSHTNYYQAYLIPELEHILNECALISNKDLPNNKLQKKLMVLRKEIIKLKVELPNIPLPTPVNLEDNLSTYTNHDYLLYFNYLKKISTTLKNDYNLNLKKKEKLKSILDIEYKKRGYTSFEEIKKYHFNESLDELLRNVNKKSRIELYKDEYIQNIDPIYNYPIPSHFLDYRTHIFTPVKHICGKLIDTFWFNITIIWLLTSILYISLYFNLLKLTLNIFSRIRIKYNES